MENQLGPSENQAARFFVTGLQPGPAQPNPARFAKKEASPAQPSPLAKMASRPSLISRFWVSVSLFFLE